MRPIKKGLELKGKVIFLLVWLVAWFLVCGWWVGFFCFSPREKCYGGLSYSWK